MCHISEQNSISSSCRRIDHILCLSAAICQKNNFVSLWILLCLSFHLTDEDSCSLQKQVWAWVWFGCFSGLQVWIWLEIRVMKRHLHSAQPGKHLEKTTLANSIDFSPVGNKKKKNQSSVDGKQSIMGICCHSTMLTCLRWYSLSFRNRLYFNDWNQRKMYLFRALFHWTDLRLAYLLRFSHFLKLSSNMCVWQPLFTEWTIL